MELVQGYLAAVSIRLRPGKAEQNNITPDWDQTSYKLTF